jgi:hypothetical protein
MKWTNKHIHAPLHHHQTSEPTKCYDESVTGHHICSCITSDTSITEHTRCQTQHTHTSSTFIPLASGINKPRIILVSACDINHQFITTTKPNQHTAIDERTNDYTDLVPKFITDANALLLRYYRLPRSQVYPELVDHVLSLYRWVLQFQHPALLSSTPLY